MEKTNQSNSDIELFQTSRGKIYGWSENGKIYLTKDGLQPDTLIHEYTHLWAKAMMKNNPVGWEEVKDLLVNSQKWNEVLLDEQYQDVWSDQDKLASECLARYSAEMNAPKFFEGLTGYEQMSRKAKHLAVNKFVGEKFTERVCSSLNSYWHWTCENIFHRKTNDLKEVTDKVLYDMLKGVDLSKSVSPVQISIEKALDESLSDEARFHDIEFGELSYMMKKEFGAEKGSLTLRLPKEKLQQFCESTYWGDRGYFRSLTKTDILNFETYLKEFNYVLSTGKGEDKTLYLCRLGNTTKTGKTVQAMTVKLVKNGDEIVVDDMKSVYFNRFDEFKNDIAKASNSKVEQLCCFNGDLIKGEGLSAKEKNAEKPQFFEDKNSGIEMMYAGSALTEDENVVQGPTTKLFYNPDDFGFTFSWPYKHRDNIEGFTRNKFDLLLNSDGRDLGLYKIFDLMNKNLGIGEYKEGQNPQGKSAIKDEKLDFEKVVKEEQMIARLIMTNQYKPATFEEKVKSELINNTDVMFVHNGGTAHPFTFDSLNDRYVLKVNLDTNESPSKLVDSFLSEIRGLWSDRQFEVMSYLLKKFHDSNIDIRLAKEEDLDRVKQHLKDVTEMHLISPLIIESQEENEKTDLGPRNLTEMVVNKIISGGQTGVDTIGLEVGSELGIKTGGTAPKGFYREREVDAYSTFDLKNFGLKEISDELQSGYGGKKFYLPRTRENVFNSDGTVYFSIEDDGAGLQATKSFAEELKKPFLLNPTSEQLSEWIKENKIHTLNVAGNRGSLLPAEKAKEIRDILRAGIKNTVSLLQNPKKQRKFYISGLLGSTMNITRKSIEESNKYNIYFDELLSYGSKTPFSINLQEIGYKNDVTYEFDSVAQAVQAFKCMFSASTENNDKIFSEILNTTDELKLESLGRKIEGQNTVSFRQNARQIIDSLVKASFRCNPAKKEKLCKASGKILVSERNQLLSSKPREFEYDYLQAVREYRSAMEREGKKQNVTFKQETRKHNADNGKKLSV